MSSCLGPAVSRRHKNHLEGHGSLSTHVAFLVSCPAAPPMQDMNAWTRKVKTLARPNPWSDSDAVGRGKQPSRSEPRFSSTPMRNHHEEDRNRVRNRGHS